MNNITNDYYIRDITYKDYINFKKVFLQLENTIDFTEDKFIDIINKLDQQNSKIKVVIDNKTNLIIGIGKILIEYKFGNNKAYIDDLVIDSKYRNKYIGSFLLNELINIAKSNNCYCIKLISDIKNIDFYKKNNFIMGNEINRYLLQYNIMNQCYIYHLRGVRG